MALESTCCDEGDERSQEETADVELLVPGGETANPYHQGTRKTRRLLVAVVTTCVSCVLFVWFTSWGWRPVQLENDAFTHQTVPQQQEDSHRVPTFLSIVHEETGDYLNALENPLYKELLNATFITTSTEFMLEETSPRVLQLDRTELSFGDPLVVSWTESSSTMTSRVLHPIREVDKHNANDKDDIVALYCGREEEFNPHQFREAASLSQIRATSKRALHDLQYHAQNNVELQSFEKKLGTLLSKNNTSNVWYIESFPIVREETCQFRLWKRLPQMNTYPRKPRFILESVSPVLRLKNSMQIPTAIHLALTGNASEISISFNTGEEGTPVVMYGKASENNKPTVLKHKVEGGVTNTYQATDMCQEPATSTDPGSFIPPGYLHTITLRGLDLDTNHDYKVGLAGGQGITWSNIHRFRTTLPIGSTQPLSLLVYADQGCPEFGWAMGANITAALVEQHLNERNVNPSNLSSPMIRGVHHFGDLSYARGAAHIWDAWFQMISVFTTRVPLMIGIGNHEYCHTDGGQDGKDPSLPYNDISGGGFHPSWSNCFLDSGGECGVPTSKRFTMPSNGNGVFWYSHDVGSVHTIMISTEHNATKGSVQYDWILQDLQAVNRSITPWIIVEMHRPMYMSEARWEQNSVDIGLRYELEDLLYQYQVDLVLAGHYHAYLRSCDGLYRGICNTEKQGGTYSGPVHITVGTAGAPIDSSSVYQQNWTVTLLYEWGIGRVTVFNSTVLHWEFVSANPGDEGIVKDDTFIIRNR